LLGPGDHRLGMSRVEVELFIPQHALHLVGSAYIRSVVGRLCLCVHQGATAQIEVPLTQTKAPSSINQLVDVHERIGKETHETG
jgi:hypothetical protein